MAKKNNSDNGDRAGYGSTATNTGYGRGYGYKLACLACSWAATLAMADSAGAAPSLAVIHNGAPIASGDTVDLGQFALNEPAGVALVIRNFGNEALVFAPNSTELGSLTGTLTNFSADLSAGSIAPGGLAILPIGFTPDGLGSVSVEVLINSNDPINAQYSITLIAEATAPLMSVSKELSLIESGDTLDLGEVGVGDTVGDAFVVRNFGSGPLKFDNFGGATLTQVSGNIADAVVNAPTAEIAAGGFAIVSFSFSALEAGTTQVRLTLNTNDPATPQFEVLLHVSVLEAQAPALLVSFELETLNPGDTFDLGSIEVAGSLGEAFTVRNIGNATLTFGGATEKVTLEELTGGDVTDFAAELNTNQIVAGGFAILTVAFDPTSVGPREVALTIHTDDPINPQYTFTLTAEALEPQVEPVAQMRVEKNQATINSGDTYDLGELLLGQTISHDLAIHNDGDGPLVIAPAMSQGHAGFEYEVPLNQEIAPGDMAVMTVSYAAATTGEYASNLTMITNDPGQATYSIIFTVTAVDQEVDLAPRIQVAANGSVIENGDSYDLGIVQTGFIKTQSFLVSNLGNAPLHFDPGFDRVEVFELTDGNVDDVTASLSENAIAPGQSATLVLTLTIPDATAREFEIAMATDDPQAPEFSFFVTVNAVTDCNENGIEDGTDIASGASEDCNVNGTPDECEIDSDGDGVIDGCDRCAGLNDLADSDGDGVVDCLDNCPERFNPNQSDVDGNGVGDACDDLEPGREMPNMPCGAGGLALLPMMMMGLCGMRGRRFHVVASRNA